MLRKNGTSGTGAQIREYRDGQFIKSDDGGKQQASSEVYASNIGKFIKNLDILEYQYYMEDTEKCVSIDMCNKNEVFLPLYTFITTSTEYDLDNVNTPEEFAEIISYITNIEYDEVLEWIVLTLIWDRLIMNMDRHLDNFAVIRNIKDYSFRIAPVFDNGCSFLFDEELEAYVAMEDMYAIEHMDLYTALYENNISMYLKPFGEIDFSEYKKYNLKIDIKGLREYIIETGNKNVMNVISNGLLQIKNIEEHRDIGYKSNIFG